jgi:hypothetical protein
MKQFQDCWSFDTSLPPIHFVRYKEVGLTYNRLVAEYGERGDGDKWAVWHIAEKRRIRGTINYILLAEEWIYNWHGVVIREKEISPLSPRQEG